jgi:hypothetical protein
MRKIIAILLIAMTILPSITVDAKWIYENGEMVLSPDSYTEDGKIKVFCTFEQKMQLNMELPKIEISLPSLEFVGADGKFVQGKVTYPNIDKITAGNFDLQWVFAPDDSKYETISGVLNFYVWPEDSEASKGKMPDPEPEEIDEPTPPSLTATTVTLSTLTEYDINLDNKVSGSTYLWSSSDTDIVEVNPKNGLIKAKKEGRAIITCEITLPDGTVQTLQSIVTVGYDENAPVLTETVLDLEVGDKFDINLENKIAKSKYRWVSSDRSVVKVNSSNGKVTAVGVGEVYVTCTITTPDNQVIVLRCDINVTEPIKTIE